VDLNTRGRYAVMAMADLTKYGVTRAISLSEIADRQKLSEAYLGQIFTQLRQAGLVESMRGRSGGYQLARPAKDITVADVMTAVEERTRMTRCSIDSGIGCVGDKQCLTHGLWAALERNIELFLSDVSMQDIIDNGPALQMHATASLKRSSGELAAE